MPLSVGRAARTLLCLFVQSLGAGVGRKLASCWVVWWHRAAQAAASEEQRVSTVTRSLLFGVRKPRCARGICPGRAAGDYLSVCGPSAPADTLLFQCVSTVSTCALKCVKYAVYAS